MAYHGVLIPEQIAAMNIDSLNRHAYASGSSTNIDNGYVFTLNTKVGSTGSSVEVWEVGTPSASASTLANLWMAYSGDEIPVTDSRYKGLDPDPRNFYNASGKVFSAYKPALYDIITLTDAAIAGSYVAGGTTHINATDATMQLTWGTSQTADVTSYQLLKKHYISLATGAIDDQRVDAYEFVCVHA